MVEELGLCRRVFDSYRTRTDVPKHAEKCPKSIAEVNETAWTAYYRTLTLNLAKQQLRGCANQSRFVDGLFVIEY